VANKNSSIAEMIGVKASMVYKIKRGDRLPGFKTMIKIEQTTKWSINEQIQARRQGNYAKKFTEVVSS
jgi:ribosome-binding protein aMBF1 (putative translation factor)